MRNVLPTAWRAWPARHLTIILVALSLLAGLASGAGAQALKGEVTAAVENGHARLVFQFGEEIEAQTRLANNILTITFPRPVDIAIDRLSSSAPEYIGAARRDPDGKGVRIALARKVTMNSMTAGERLFVDLLPETWTGLPPGLPRDVIDELARRARDAERRIRQQRILAQQTKSAPVRVRVIAQPTFMRYVFDLPELIGVSADNGRDKLTLTFDALLRFDLADVKATMPEAIGSIDSEIDHDAVLVRFSFNSRVDVRTFREDNSFVVDVETPDRRTRRPNGTVRSDELAAMGTDQPERPSPPQVAAPKSAPAPKQQAAAPAVAAPPAERPAAPVAAPAAAPAATPAPPAPAAPSSPPAASAPPATAPAAPLVAYAGASVAPPPAAPPPATTPAGGAAAAPVGAPAPGVAPAVAAPATTPVEPAADGGVVRAAVRRLGDNVSIAFPFAVPTAAAIFRRADAVWMVFETDAQISVAALNGEAAKVVRSASVTRLRDIVLVRVKLERPQQVSVAADENQWTVTLANELVEPTRALQLVRHVAAGGSSVSIGLDETRGLHRIEDPDVGDTLVVAIATAPARGLAKTQEFVEFRALASAHGVALQLHADDVTAELAGDKIIVARPGGLSLSSATRSSARLFYQRQVLDQQSWGFDRQATFAERKAQLMMAAADAPEAQRLAARCDLARFFLARDMFVEAKGVLDVALVDHPPSAEDTTALVLRAIANVMIGRADAALNDLGHPLVGSQHEAPLWRALALARLGRWVEARDGFRNSEAALAALPLEFRRAILRDMIRVALEVGDITGATNRLEELGTVGVTRELEPSLSVLTGRLAEALGRLEDALRAYRAANDSWDRPAAAQGRLREVQLLHGRGNSNRATAIDDLETLTMIWRGDQTEIEALQLLGRLYTEEGRYRDAFNVMRTALRVHPNSDMTRRIQDEAVTTFDTLFLAGKGDALPAIDALALFYDFRELTPIGRRGDEMIRRLADRLVTVDLLFQASELLQHQVDNRTQGAARAQVAARLAVVYLMDRKPAKALAALRLTRISQLNNDLRNQRLLLEGRALSETGRSDLALEVIANIPGREAIRLRSDILWAVKRFAAAAEQLELLLGDRWQEFGALTDADRGDVMRAAIGYALGDDAIGIARFRERYLSKMAESPDAHGFELVTAPIGGATSGEFREIVRSLAAVDTLEAFLRDLRARYPETGALPPGVAASPPTSAPAAEAPAVPASAG